MTAKAKADKSENTDADDLDEDEMKAFESTPATAASKQAGARSEKPEEDASAPASAYFNVKKRPRGAIVLSGMKDRIVVIHKGHFRYYRAVPAEEVSPFVPFLSIAPQGDMKGGIEGCTATKDESFKDGLTVKVSANGKASDIFVQMESEEKLAEMLKVFAEHVAYYEEKPIPALEPEDW